MWNEYAGAPALRLHKKGCEQEGGDRGVGDRRGNVEHSLKGTGA